MTPLKIETEGARSDAIGAELRLRLIQMDRELEEQEQKLREERRRTQETEREMEQKEMHIARLMAESQRYRKAWIMAFELARIYHFLFGIRNEHSMDTVEKVWHDYV